MPNTQVGTTQRELVNALLMATGAVEWIADEALMEEPGSATGGGAAR